MSSTRKRTLVILGAGGDLTSRLLLPGLGQLLSSGRGFELELIGVDNAPMTDAAWRKRVTASFTKGGAESSRVKDTIARSRYLHADATDAAELERVLAECSNSPALYCALPPHVWEKTVDALRTLELPAGLTLAVEKPFGTDLKSARVLNRKLEKLIPENRVQRVDHFLGKSTVLNILGFRFANRIFEPVWNADNVERIEICYDERLGLESRAGYYDKAGAMVDMIQSHLLQVLALVAMEPPSSIDADDLRGAMAQVLRATKVWNNDPVNSSKRARYTAGTIGKRSFPAYAKEEGVDPSRKTETLAEVTFGIDNWRWSGVPFVLRSGKALGTATKSVTVTFKDVPHLPIGLKGQQRPAAIRIGLNPETLELDLNINGAGSPFELDDIVLAAEFAEGDLDAYGEVLDGILDGDPSLSVRGDVAEECWRIIEPVSNAWTRNEVPLDSYAAGADVPRSWRTAGRALGVATEPTGRTGGAGRTGRK